MSKVSSVYRQITLEPYLISNHESLESVLQMFKQINPIHRSLYVVGENNLLLGIITLQEIFNIYSIKKGVIKSEKLSKPVLLDYIVQESTAEQIMRKNISISPNDSLDRAVELMIRENLHELPVVNDVGQVIGDLNVHELLRELHIKTLSEDIS